MGKKLEQYKNKLAAGEITTINYYEPAINELLDEVDNKGVLNVVFTDEQVQRLVNLAETSNAASQLRNSFTNIFHGTSNEMKSRVAELEKVGLKINYSHYGTILCHSYQVMSELLKVHLVTMIDFEALGLKNADSKPLGTLLSKLKKEFPGNKFIDYLNTGIRNAVTHYTYYFEPGRMNKIYLCKGVFDPKPDEMSLADFLFESKKLNILVESLLIIYLDKHFPDGDLDLDDF